MGKKQPISQDVVFFSSGSTVVPKLTLVDGENVGTRVCIHPAGAKGKERNPFHFPLYYYFHQCSHIMRKKGGGNKRWCQKESEIHQKTYSLIWNQEGVDDNFVGFGEFPSDGKRGALLLLW